MDDKLDKAIEYAKATNSIEDLDMSKQELEDIKSAILGEKTDESYLYSIVKKINTKDDRKKENGKIK